MLLQFAIENFLSFRERTVLSLVASDDTGHPEHVWQGPNGLRVLRCVVLYGANASGKSNLLKALDFALKYIIGGTRPGQHIIAPPFKIVDKPKPNSQFEWEFLCQGMHHSYGFVLSNGTVQEEWLYRKDGGQDAAIFERDSPKNIIFGDLFSAERERGRFVADGTRAEQLFLTEAAERDLSLLRPVYDFFRQHLMVMAPQQPIDPRQASRAMHMPRLLPFLRDSLRSAGTGVHDLLVRRTPLTPKQSKIYRQALSQVGSEDIPPAGALVVQAPEQDPVEMIQGQTSVRLVTTHLTETGTEIEMELREESDGTRRFLNLASALYWAQDEEEHANPIVIIDELERSLHPLLTRKFLGDFLAGGGCQERQLLCTTHDTNLLSLSLLRPDEIWFVEKDAAQGSHMYSLAEFKRDQLDRLGDNFEQGYLNGRFGAIPFFGDLGQLGLGGGGKR